MQRLIMNVQSFENMTMARMQDDDDDGQHSLKLWDEEDTQQKRQRKQPLPDDQMDWYKKAMIVSKALVGKKLTVQAMHNNKFKVKAYGQNLKKTTLKLCDDLDKHSSLLGLAFATKKPGMTEMQNLIKAALESSDEASNQLGIISKLV